MRRVLKTDKSVRSFATDEGGAPLKQKILSVVQQVLFDFLIQKKMDSSDKHILIILAYESEDPSQVWDVARKVCEAYPTYIAYTEEWRPVPDHTGAEYTFLLDKTNKFVLKQINQLTDLIVFPVISFRFLAKLALLIDDELAVHAAMQMQLDGKRVLIGKDQIEIPVLKKLTVPGAFRDKIQTYLNQLRRDHVEWARLNELLASISNGATRPLKRPVLLAKHIEELAAEGQYELVVPTQTVVTPMSKELAKQYGVSIGTTIHREGG